MINFPILDQLKVSGYGMYPGCQAKEGLSIEFQPGLTLILGANGLGKTTLVTIIYRLLTGPYDIPALATGTTLGNARLQAIGISRSRQKVFADRVTDGASDAFARLKFFIDGVAVVIERRLNNLELTKFVIDDEEQELDEAKFYQTLIADMAGVWSFGDWILILRNMVFYFEDRRALVWDTSAQKQLMRCLFLPPSVAKKWTEDERAILELDSKMRNLRATVFSEEKDLARVNEKVRKSKNVRQELRTLEDLQSSDLSRREDLDQGFLEIDNRLKKSQLRLLRAQQERESRYREFERAKLKAVESRFPQKSESAKYIFDQLFADAECLVCGSYAPKASALLEKKISGNNCVVCGTDLSEAIDAVPTTKLADRRVKKAEKSLEEIEPELEEALNELRESESEAKQLRLELAELDAEVTQRSVRIDALIDRLPPEEQEIHKQRSELASMRSKVSTMTNEITERRNEFSAFIEKQNRKMVSHSGDIRAAFAKFAEGFLLETVELVWSPQFARVGQTGEPIEFPAFELDMSGTDFPTPVRRSGPEQVSESQREFIDLAFRMALMEIASGSGKSSLVIDAPESSLDAVFVSGAAIVLSRFADIEIGNRLAIASNLVEGELVPELLKLSAPAGERMSRVVDLLQIAEPTAAIRERRSDYDKVLKNLYKKIEPPKRRSRKTSKNPPRARRRKW
ncbi:MAG: AAA family ATPase [Alphaproteobacteria bacterium]|nr:AAA family ATPase [Alphaproteobacteria bacterium]